MILAVFALMAALRMVALSSDAYTRLDWSAGILTDEGFYSHNARNVTVLGHARTDDFNNMLVSPVLHYLQVGVFRLFGSGVVPLRMISVVCSLLALLLLWAALRPIFGRGVALAAICVLGFDHMALLQHRLGLMDTPASLPVVLALWTFSKALQADGAALRRWLWLVGGALGFAFVVRSLCAYLAPVPLIALWFWSRPSAGSEGGVGSDRLPWRHVLLPFAGVLALYGVLWWLPHRAELATMNRYYLFHQILPGSLAHLWWNVYHAVLGDFRGVAPYLFRHSPAVFTLALAWLAGLVLGVRPFGEDRRQVALAAYLVAWLLCGWALLAVIGYSPSRYYVTTYPALAALAALGLRSLPAIWGRVWRGDARARAVRGALAWFLAYHAVESLVHRGGVVPHMATMVLLYGLPTVVAAALAALPGGLTVSRAGRAVAVALAVAWVGVNAAWLTHWATHIRSTQIEMSRWLAATLPEGSVLIGDVAPGVSMETEFTAVNVIPGLCNGVKPVERFAAKPRYVVILDGRWKEAYWTKHYPEIVMPERRLTLRRVLRWDVGVYAVD